MRVSAVLSGTVQRATKYLVVSSKYIAVCTSQLVLVR